LTSNLVLAQQVSVVQYSSFCEGSNLVEQKFVSERIRSLQKIDVRTWQVDAVIIRDCGGKLYPEVEQSQDTVFIEIHTIEMATYRLSNDKVVTELYQPEECYCAYQLKMQVSVDTIGHILVDKKQLKISDEKFLTYPIRYFVFKGDTTGYVDRYGLRQGHMVILKPKYILKSFYKDNIQTGCEIWDLKGENLIQAGECVGLLESKK